MKIRCLAAAGVVILGLHGCRRERVREPATFEVHDAWVRSAPDSGATTAAYMTLVNGTSHRLVITGFSSDAARRVELHRTSIAANGASSMTMTDSLTIPTGDTVSMRPGGYHLMLLGITQPLHAGTMTRLVMHLSDGSIVSTSAKVKD